MELINTYSTKYFKHLDERKRVEFLLKNNFRLLVAQKSSLLLDDLKEEKEIELKFNLFPDGQIQVYIDDFPSCEYIKLSASVVNSTCLDIFLQLVEFLKGEPSLHTIIEINYHYGSRCDKGKFKTCKILDSYYESLYTNRKWKHVVVVPFNIHHVSRFNQSSHTPIKILNDVLEEEAPFDYILYPDESAKARFDYTLPHTQYFHEQGDPKYAVCTKVRNQETGEIVSHTFPKLSGRVLVLDDILDGGRTYLNVLEQYPNCELVLFTWHLVMSNSENIKRILNGYNRVYTTNSYLGRTFSNTYEKFPSKYKDKLKIINIW